MRAVYRRIAGAVAAGVVSVASPDLATGARIETRPLRVQADFQHVPATGPPYSTRLTGVLDLGFTTATDGTAQALSLVGGGSCFSTVGWTVQSMPPMLTAPAEVCLANDAIDEAGLNAWMSGLSTFDPSLAIPLAGAGSPPTSWTNPGTVPIQLFLRGCGVGTYRRLGRMLVPPGALHVQAIIDPAGEEQLDVTAMSVSLIDLSPAVWADVLMGCGGGAAGLPTAPDAGLSTQVIGTTAMPPGDPSLPHVQIAQIRDAVEDLVETQVLLPGKGRALQRKLDKTIKKLRQAKADGATRQLGRFQTLTLKFEQRGFLPSVDGAALRSQAGAAAAGIVMITIDGIAPPPDPDLFCEPAPAACPDLSGSYTTYHVRGGGGGIGLAPDGSEARPYRTIVAALAAAEANALPRVELRVAGALYTGDLVITRSTRIIGDPRGPAFIEGSISSDGAYRLELRDVRVGPPAGIGISVDDACASTRVDGVRVEGARGYGILQRGGSIEIADTIVQDTESEAVNLTRGTGIYLACGVGARLDDVQLVSNASAGLVVAGEDTTALGANLHVADTGVHPSLAADLCAAPALMGAVQVRLGASAGFNLFTIRDNDVIGLLVAGEDAAGRASDATFRDGTIDRTGALAGDCAGGNNIMVIDSGELELGDFTCAEADLAGILLARDGEADLESGTVSSNLIGAAVQTVGFDLSRLQPRVRYVDNGRNLDATVLPIPDAAGDVGP
jgi:hypothetical protein